MVIDAFSPVCDNSICVKFADDLTILNFVRGKEDDLLQCEFLHLEAWSRSVGLSLNFEKCCVMNYVTNKCLTFDSLVSADGDVLTTVSSLKLLGVTFSCDFSWNLHVNDIVRKCYRRFYILRNLKRSGCPPSVVHKCYVAFVRSLLLYCLLYSVFL